MRIETTTSGTGSGVTWERELFAFLRQELAPSPARWRATLRITTLCAVAITLVMALHIPDGEFLLVCIFVVSQSDAWASLTKAWLRVVATVLGGAFAIIILLACADKPWLLFPLHAVAIAVALFLSQTSTIPYAFLLGGITFFIVVPEFAPSPIMGLEKGLWRILLTVVGVLLTVAGQFGLWPDDPEELLLTDLAARLKNVERILDRLVTGPTTKAATANTRSPTALIAAAGLARHLDLLANAEAMSRWLRQRHTEQVKLISGIGLLITAALRLDRVAAEQDSPTALPDWVRERLKAIRAECARLRSALEERRPPEGQAEIRLDGPHEHTVTDTGTSALLPSVYEMERVLATMPTTMAFLGTRRDSPVAGLTEVQPSREPVAEQPLFTSACTLANVEVIHSALKGALAVSVCGLLMQAFDSPGLATSLVTCVTVAQSSSGASRRKSLLRFIGATLGGLAALVVIVVVTPNTESLAPFLVATTALFTAAAWLSTGSSRISYVGLQTGIAMSLVLINSLAPTTDLTPARDRLLGVLLGIVVMGGIDFALWPVFARATFLRKLAEVLRQMATRQRLASQQNREKARDTSFTIHRNLTDTLSLQDDLLFESGLYVSDAAKERQALLQLINQLQDVFLKLLAVSRQELGMNLDSVAQPVLAQLHALDEEVAKNFEALAGRLDHRQDVAVTTLDQPVAHFEDAVNARVNQESTPELTLAQLKAHVVLYRELLTSLRQLEQDMQAATGAVAEQVSPRQVPIASPAKT